MEFNFNKKTKKEKFMENRIPSGCAVFGIFNQSGSKFNGNAVLEGISMMHDRSNGLGGGFAAYGIYPELKDEWAFHFIFEDLIAKKQSEDIMEDNFEIVYSEKIPTNNKVKVQDPPLLFRYFLRVKSNLKESEEDFVVNFVISVNSNIRGAYIISSGKNMGIFKGVGFPEDIGQYFKIDEYEGYLWTAHGRFPTNSVGWWGGAHPFGLLNWSVVHNGEISSYGTNKRFVNDFGYKCTLSTDTEVITYLFDLLNRKQKIDIKLIHLILASPLWEEIERMPTGLRVLAKNLRMLYGSSLVNGPFNIIVGHNNFMYALNDRIKLRPMVAARDGAFLYISSEEAAIRKVCSSPELLWHPDGGEPVFGMLDKLQNDNNQLKDLAALS
ncbi:MAG: class II glutamine amidotransferase [Actinomycetota bacterium]